MKGTVQFALKFRTLDLHEIKVICGRAGKQADDAAIVSHFAFSYCASQLAPNTLQPFLWHCALFMLL